MNRKVFLCVLTVMWLLSLTLFCGAGYGEDLNAVWDGPWQSVGGAAALTVEGGAAQEWDVAASFMFDGCDVERETGSTVATMILILSSRAADASSSSAGDDRIQIPMLLDGETLTTENRGGNTWGAKTASGRAEFTVTVDAENMNAVVSGTIVVPGGFRIELKDINLEKQTFHQHFDIEKILNGTWTASSWNGGGFIEMDKAGERSVYMTSSAHAVNATFSFKDTDTENDTATLKGDLSVSAQDFSGRTATFPFTFDSAQSGPATVEHLFGSIYRLKAGGAAKGFLIFESETQAQLVLNIMAAPDAGSRTTANVTARLNRQ